VREERIRGALDLVREGVERREVELGGERVPGDLVEVLAELDGVSCRTRSCASAEAQKELVRERV